MTSLCVRHLTCGYAARAVLHDVSFDLDAGQILCVLGPNGSGKSTLFRTLLGLLPPLGGDVLLDGQALTRLPPRQRARAVAYVPQFAHSAFGFSVLDTVLMGRACHLSPLAMPGAHDREAALDALDALGMAGYAARTFTECSGGEQQLILCARALAQGAPMLVLDEPTASLDFGNALRVLEHLRWLAARGYMLLVSTHNPEMALRYAHKVLLVHAGQVLGVGDPQTLLDADMMYQLYGVYTQRLSVQGTAGVVHVFVP